MPYESQNGHFHKSHSMNNQPLPRLKNYDNKPPLITTGNNPRKPEEPNRRRGCLGIIENDIVKPLEPKKCKGWRLVTLDELVKLVSSEKQRSWIPLHEVLFYVKQNWRI